MAFYNTFANYLGDDVTTDFAVPFSYTSQNEVVVTRQGGPVSYTFINPALIQIDAPLATGDALKIERDTSLASKKVVFANGSPATAGMLNTAFDQLLQGLQEASDTAGSQLAVTDTGDWDALGRKITNVTDPTLAQDVATKNYVDTGVSSGVVQAQASASAAADSASTASTKASEASASASNASSSASAASTSASTATTKANEASTSASTASTAATTATSAKAAAEAARDATLTAFDNFDDRYLGAKASDPTLDNDGAALVAGALYFDTTTEAMKVYTGSAWVAAYVSGTGFVAKAGDTMTGTLNLPANGLTVGTNQLVASGGNVGIGTSSPLTRLSINGGGFLGTADGDYYGGGAYYNSGWKSSVSSQGGWVLRNSSGLFTVLTAPANGAAGSTLSMSERMRIDGNGNVGIGTSSPSKKLDVSGTGARIYLTNANEDIDMDGSASGQLSLDGNGYGGAIALNSDGMQIYHNSVSRSLIFGTNETERMRIDSAGNVGIGTASVRSRLHVDYSTADDTFNTLISSYRPNLVLEDKSSGATDYQMFVDSNALQFRYGDASTNVTLSSEAMRIENTGEVKVGSSSTGSARFYVYDGTFSYAFRGYSTAGFGVYAQTTSTTAGHAGVYGIASAGAGYGVRAQSYASHGTYSRTLSASYAAVAGYNWDNSVYGWLGYGSYGVYSNGIIRSTSGGFMFPDGTTQTTAASGGGTNIQKFTGSGTWTKPSGFDPDSRVLIQIWSGGSSGQLYPSTSLVGGSGGGYLEVWKALWELPASGAITVGAGGAGITAAGFYSNAGGSSSAFGFTVNGAGGTTPSGAGTPGKASVDFGTTVFDGGVGANSGSSSVAGNALYGGGGGGGWNAQAAGGIGASGGNGGAGVTTTGANGTDGVIPGGGGGASYGGTTSGAGAGGQVIVIVMPK